jgi:hypothetical protein
MVDDETMRKLRELQLLAEQRRQQEFNRQEAERLAREEAERAARDR